MPPNGPTIIWTLKKAGKSSKLWTLAKKNPSRSLGEPSQLPSISPTVEALWPGNAVGCILSDPIINHLASPATSNELLQPRLSAVYNGLRVGCTAFVSQGRLSYVLRYWRWNGLLRLLLLQQSLGSSGLNCRRFKSGTGQMSNKRADIQVISN